MSRFLDLVYLYEMDFPYNMRYVRQTKYENSYYH